MTIATWALYGAKKMAIRRTVRLRRSGVIGTTGAAGPPPVVPAAPAEAHRAPLRRDDHG